MKRTTLLVTLLFLALAPALSAQDTYTGETRDAIEARGVTNFQVELGNGFTVVLRGSDTDSISYHYQFEGNRLAHERNFNQAEFRLERQGATAMLSIQFPELEQMRRETNQSWLQRLFGSDIRNFNIEKQELRVNMPRDLAVHLATRYSDVDLSAIERDLEVTTRSGTVNIRDVGGNVNVRNEYGNATVEQVGGSLQLTSRSSDLAVRDVEGETRINSPYSNVEISDIRSRVSVQTQSGTLDAGQIRGPLQVQADYSKVTINGVEGAVSVRSRSGSLTVSDVPTLEFAGEYTDLQARNLTGSGTNTIGNRSASVNLTNVAGETRVTGEYMEVTLEDLRGDLHVQNRSGSVKGDGITHAARINGEYLDISLNRFSGSALHIRNQSGDVNVVSTGTLSQVDIQVTYGDVRFALGAAYNGRYSLSTQYGKLALGSSPFAVDLETDNPDARDQNVTGTVGTANNNFRIQARNGDVTVTASY